MLKNIFTIAALFIAVSLYSDDSVFNMFFADGAVRYDFELIGNSETVEAVHVQSKYLLSWGGNPSCLTDELNYGTFRYRIFDIELDSLIFSKGFSPLFHEWQMTEEAITRIRSFYQALFFPRPLNNVKIIVEQRDAQNLWHEVFIDTFRVDDVFVIDETPDYYEVDTVMYHGHASGKVDVVLLAEGYTLAEMDKFSADARRMIDSLFDAEPFKSNKEKFNVIGLKVPSAESGVDKPGERIYKNTAFNSHFYTFGSPRYLTVTDMKAVYDALDAVAWDQLYVLVNSSRYGGGGCYNFFNVSSVDHERSAFVFCHEFAHGFAGLADEYYTSSTAYDNFYNTEIEPVEPNITSLVNFDSKWKDMLSVNVPVPTPRTEEYNNSVGVFEGGGYMSKGIYSPVQSCWMKEESAGGFCPVCRRAIERVILLHTK